MKGCIDTVGTVLIAIYVALLVVCAGCASLFLTYEAEVEVDGETYTSGWIRSYRRSDAEAAACAPICDDTPDRNECLRRCKSRSTMKSRRGFGPIAGTFYVREFHWIDAR